MTNYFGGKPLAKHIVTYPPIGDRQTTKSQFLRSYVSVPTFLRRFSEIEGARTTAPRSACDVHLIAMAHYFGAITRADVLIQHGMLHWITNAGVAGVTIGCLFSLLASWRVLQLARPSPRSHGPVVPVTILKPLHGVEPGLLAQLLSFCNQDYTAPVQIVFGMHEPDDPALEVVRQLKAAFPDRAIEYICNSREYGSNRKISNLLNMTPLAKHDVMIIADSDIRVGPDYLTRLTAELRRPGVGAVTCTYRGVAGSGLWSEFAALAINLHFLPQVVVALAYRLAHPCFGATIALRRSTLDRIGGFEAFADYLAEDYAIGEAVRALGQEVVIAHLEVGHVCAEDDLPALLAQQFRFARTIRSIDPVGHIGSLMCNPLAFALLAAPFAIHPALLLTTALGCRFVLCLAVESAFSLPGQRYWLIPIHDAMSFLIYTASLFGSEVSWRGHRYRLLPDGRLALDRDEPPFS